MNTPADNNTVEPSISEPGSSPIENVAPDSPTQPDLPDVDLPALSEEPHNHAAPDLFTPETPQAPDMSGGQALIAGQQTDEHGNPLWNKNGSPKMKRGRKPGQKSIAKSDSTMPVSLEKTIETTQLDAALTSQVVIGATTKILSGLIGPEWAIQDQKEFDELHLPLTKYLESKNVTDVPPGVLLLVAIGGYAIKRIESENTKTKFFGMIARTRMWGEKLVKRFWG